MIACDLIIRGRVVCPEISMFPYALLELMGRWQLFNLSYLFFVLRLRVGSKHRVHCRKALHDLEEVLPNLIIRKVEHQIF